MRRSLFAAVLGVLLISGANLAARQEPSKDSIENGRRAYVRTGCYQCHGREGQGSPATGPRLGPNPSPFPAFEAWVRQPKGEMPPYTSKVLSQTELADIYAFLRTRPRPAPASRLPF